MLPHHHHHHVMDRDVMDHHQDHHLLVVQEEDHRRHHRLVHHDRVDRNKPIIHYCYIVIIFNKEENKTKLYFELFHLTSFSFSKPNETKHSEKQTSY